jgi:hypothetical protein
VTDWISLDEAKLSIGIPLSDTTDDEWLALCVAGVNQLITDTRPGPYPATLDPWAVEPEPETNGRIQWGASQLASRWYSRRNSVDMSAFVEMGGPPPSIDRDIEIALQIGRYFGPAVA